MSLECPDKRTVEEQLRDGWFLKYHPKMRTFYTYHPENEAGTFGRRSLSRQQVRNLLKRGRLVEVGRTGEIFRAAPEEARS